MKKVIIINGPIGVGKTTVNKLLCNRLNKSAMIDGDWCFDLHPFVANKETRGIAVDNMVNMIRNYINCNDCNYIILNWVIDRQEVYDEILNGIKDLEFELYKITLTCDEYALENRRYNDKLCDWRIDEWLAVSKKSLQYFKGLDTYKIDTSAITAYEVADEICEIIKHAPKNKTEN